MHVRFLAASAAAAVVVAGTLALPTVAQADSTTDRGSSVGTAVQEHGVQLPAGDTLAPRYTVSPEGGGTWTYGTNGKDNTAFSNFYHKTRKHGSSVKNGAGNTKRSADKAGGETAKASIRKTYAGNTAYYRFVK